MKKLRFRVYNKKEKKLFNIGEMPDLSNYPLDTYEVMQWTGLKDKNNICVYEGDIVRENLKNQLCGKPFEIVFFNGQFCGRNYILQEASLEKREQYHLLFVEIGMIPLEYEIIGNIYENKDLLK